MTYNYFIFEGNLSSVSDFLKTNYNKIFNEPNQKLNNLFVEFTKKVDRDKNTSYLYQKYIKTCSTTIQNEINNCESIEQVNKIISDEIKFFYFSLKPVINKLQNDEFTIEDIFSKSRDKNLQALMSYPEDKFSNAVSQYIDTVLPVIKKDSGIDEVKPEENNQNTEITERIKNNILKILEADDVDTTTDLVNYKQSAIKWLNMSLFDLLKPKYQLLTKIGSTTSNLVDQLSNQMKNTSNDNAKHMILNKIVNMDKEALKNLALSLGITEEELGDL